MSVVLVFYMDLESAKIFRQTLNTQFSDNIDCVIKRSTFTRSVNKLMTNFGHPQTPVLIKPF